MLTATRFGFLSLTSECFDERRSSKQQALLDFVNSTLPYMNLMTIDSREGLNEVTSIQHTWTMYLFDNYYSSLFTNSDQDEIDPRDARFYGLSSTDSKIIKQETDDRVEFYDSKHRDKPCMHLWLHWLKLNWKIHEAMQQLGCGVDWIRSYKEDTDFQVIPSINKIVNAWPKRFPTEQEASHLNKELTLFNLHVYAKMRRQKKVLQSELFASCHFFMHTYGMLHIHTITPDFRFNEHVDNGNVNDNAMQLALENTIKIIMFDGDRGNNFKSIMWFMSIFPGLRDIYIYDETFDAEKDRVRKKIVSEFLIGHTLINKDALMKYQKQRYDFLMAGRRAIYDGFDYYLKMDNPSIFQLIVFHMRMEDEMRYNFFLFRFVIPFNAFIRYQQSALLYSEEYPLIVQVQPMEYGLLWQRRVVRYERITQLLTVWVSLIEGGRIRAEANVDTIPWVRYWGKVLFYQCDQKTERGLEAECVKLSSVVDIVQRERYGIVKVNDAEEIIIESFNGLALLE